MASVDEGEQRLVSTFQETREPPSVPFAILRERRIRMYWRGAPNPEWPTARASKRSQLAAWGPSTGA